MGQGFSLFELKVFKKYKQKRGNLLGVLVFIKIRESNSTFSTETILEREKPYNITQPFRKKTPYYDDNL